MSTLFPAALFMMTGSITPGPNNLMLLSSGLNFGIRRSLAHGFGILVGFTLLLLAISFGFGMVFQYAAWLKDVLKILGSAYMGYMAWRMVNASPAKAEQPTQTQPMTFTQALLFQWVNPKSWVYIITVVSLFTLSEDFVTNIALLGSIYVSTVMISLTIWLTLGVVIRQFIRNARTLRIFNISMAILMLGSIAMIWLD